MGTTWSLRFDNPLLIPRDAVRASAEAALDRVIAQMSTWESDSDISRFNRAAAGSRHALAPEFGKVLACALQWAAASDGAVDPTIGALVALWGFGAHANASPSPPSPAELAAARSHVGWQRIAFESDTNSILQPGGVWLDLSGIAKGFAVDQVAAELQILGLGDFLVEVGGELRGVGRRPGGQPWQVQIDAASGVATRIALSDMALATSGDRWHLRQHEGRSWSHTLDPRCGEPSGHALTAVTVLHRQCMHADALATVLTVLGPDDGLTFAQHHGIAALFVGREGAGHRALTSEAWTAQVA
ncbi:thiamine biosynthesis lipoprotein [Variovorax sp. CF079]|nr:thiamine biosynthesis lipoprotein [Variovorax sp. CF079]